LTKRNAPSVGLALKSVPLALVRQEGSLESLFHLLSLKKQEL